MVLPNGYISVYGGYAEKDTATLKQTGLERLGHTQGKPVEVEDGTSVAVHMTTKGPRVVVTLPTQPQIEALLERAQSIDEKSGAHDALLAMNMTETRMKSGESGAESKFKKAQAEYIRKEESLVRRGELSAASYAHVVPIDGGQGIAWRSFSGKVHTVAFVSGQLVIDGRQTNLKASSETPIRFVGGTQLIVHQGAIHKNVLPGGLEVHPRGNTNNPKTPDVLSRVDSRIEWRGEKGPDKPRYPYIHYPDNARKYNDINPISADPNKGRI